MPRDFYQVLQPNERFLNSTKIHPWMQRAVKDIIEQAKTNTSISKIVVFGSSVTDKCIETSDIDIVVYGLMNSHKSKESWYPNVDRDVDIISSDIVDTGSLLYREIQENGVVVYEA